MPTKQFSQGLHDAHDPTTRSLVMARLPHALATLDPERFDGLVLKQNPDIYGVDLLGITGQGERIDVEVEQKTARQWTTQYPFEDLRIPFRKYKFAHHSYPVVFVVVNWDYSQMAVTINHVLMMLRPEKVDNKYAEAEQFFRIPLEYVRFFPLKEW